MATSLYVDCNRMNSIKSDSNTNEWEYKYSSEGLTLPVGTQISLVDTFINKRGISGNSITIDNDIDEMIQFAYYHSDNGMVEPDGLPQTAADGGGYKNVYAQGRAAVVGNNSLYYKRNAEGTNTALGAAGRGNISNQDNGYSELPHFGCKIRADADSATIGFLQPLVNNLRIFIPKGTYGVVELGKLVDDQLNGNLVDVANGNFDLDYYKQQKNLGQYNGTLENSKTYKLYKALNINLPTNGTREYNGRSPNSNTGGGGSANWAVPPIETAMWMPVNKFRKMVQHWKDPAPVYNGHDPVPRDSSYLIQSTGLGVNPHPFYNGTYANNDGEVIDYYGLWFKRRFCEVGQLAGGGVEPPASRRMYDLTHKGYYVGTSDAVFQWDEERSSYTIGGLHQQYRVPSHDQYYNENEDVGEKCVVLRRPTVECENAGQDAEILSCLRNPVERYGGICVYNWGYNTALKHSDIDHTNPLKYRQTDDPDGDGGKNLWTFQDFFSSESAAKKAWKKTLWYRLGFRYEDLQSEKSWEQNKYWDNDIDTVLESTKNYGKTTRAELGVISAPTIATEHYPKLWGDDKSIRTYNNLDISTCTNNYGANITVAGCTPTRGSNVGQFYGSFYQKSTSTKILTDGKTINANNLPSLNTQGYFIVTSDLIDGYQDSAKGDKNLPLLGVVPISNLASQDFITTRNVLVHTLSQERILNSIKIKILNPDFSNPELDEFSSVVLRIEIPLLQNTIKQPDGSQDKQSTKK